MSIKSFLSVALLIAFFTSCGNDYKLTLTSPKELNVDQKLNIQISEKDNKPIDSIRYYLNGKRLTSNSDVIVETQRLGKHAVSATIFYGEKQKQLTNTIHFLAANAPEIYTYEIINEFPHDSAAFTQGFEFYNGFLYESTGQNGKSSLRKVEIETGKVLQKFDLDKQYFGEGMTIFNNKIYMLTWQKMKGLIFNLDTFTEEGEFNYNQSKQGWGLTHTTNKLIKTDGTERIWFLNAETQKEENFIEAYTNKRKADKLNEIEFINDKIFANKWQQNSILIIDPKSGAIEGIADLNGLQDKANQKGTDNVLNGIAYDAENDRMFVTGKNWDKVFEIKLNKK